eukprot:Rhum_TRINITY_DN15593_c0_g1::Rhum_TRINITY_DN15593_c0_g1_i1::g.161384::m.161384
MLKQCSVVLFNPRGLFTGGQRAINPGLNLDFKSKGVSSQVGLPRRRSPFDEKQHILTEMATGFETRVPEIMKGQYGRASQNRKSMYRYSKWYTLKWSAFRWLKKSEKRLLRVSNVAAAAEEHGLTYGHLSRKRPLQKMYMTNAALEQLAQVEPMSFRCVVEVLRSDNLVAYDECPELKQYHADTARIKKGNYERMVLGNPLPMQRRLPDPSWREMPMYQGRQHDKSFHPKHPIFLVDWKI